MGANAKRVLVWSHWVSLEKIEGCHSNLISSFQSFIVFNSKK
jgi:hypothetical protein